MRPRGEKVLASMPVMPTLRPSTRPRSIAAVRLKDAPGPFSRLRNMPPRVDCFNMFRLTLKAV